MEFMLMNEMTTVKMNFVINFIEKSIFLNKYLLISQLIYIVVHSEYISCNFIKQYTVLG